MEWLNVIQIYALGVPVWCLLMSLLGERVDADYITSAISWPIMAISMLGQAIRYIFGRKPFK
jgi:hypothetical protein